jgi:hypothetical protein
MMTVTWLDEYLAAWERHVQGAPETAEAMIRASADSVRYEDINMPDLGREPFVGHEGIRLLCAGMPDFAQTRMTVESKQVSEDGRKWAIEWKWDGTQASSGKRFVIHGCAIGSLGPDGKVTSQRDYWNRAQLLRQLGSED